MCVQANSNLTVRAFALRSVSITSSDVDSSPVSLWRKRPARVNWMMIKNSLNAKMVIGLTVGNFGFVLAARQSYRRKWEKGLEEMLIEWVGESWTGIRTRSIRGWGHAGFWRYTLRELGKLLIDWCRLDRWPFGYIEILCKWPSWIGFAKHVPSLTTVKTPTLWQIDRVDLSNRI